MYLLNRAYDNSCESRWNTFTFHYVSIKSACAVWGNNNFTPFTFHYVSIKSQQVRCYLYVKRYLHSTMYLLNLSCLRVIDLVIINLHSTMYLLNRMRTFWQLDGFKNLHSTMYLLNPVKTPVIKFIKPIYIPLCIY